MSEIIRKILIGIFCTLVVKGIVSLFDLDEKAAAMIRAAMDPQVRDAIGWIFSGCIGLAALGAWEFRPNWLRMRGSIKPDLNIRDAIDYIVNESNAVLKKPSQPKIMEFGPAKGRPLIQAGVEHEDARRLLNEAFISGHVRCWGKRAISDDQPPRFELTQREIDRFDWNDMQLHFFNCHDLTDTAPQTVSLPGQNGRYWTGLMVSHVQLQQTWPQRSALRRLLERMRGKERIRLFQPS
jgi:hypothetical protein